MIRTFVFIIFLVSQNMTNAGGLIINGDFFDSLPLHRSGLQNGDHPLQIRLRSNQLLATKQQTTLLKQQGFRILNLKTNKSTGSVSSICNDQFFYGESKKSYFFTAAHVLDTTHQVGIEIKGKIYYPKIENIFSEFDLATLSIEKLPFLDKSCLSFNGRTQTKFAFDPESAYDIPSSQLYIEALNSDLMTTVRYSFKSPLIQYIEKGIPGRDKTDHLLGFLFKGYAGLSGGPLISADSKYLLGMIIAVDPETRRVAALSSQAIFVARYFGGLDQKNKINEVRVRGGTKYLDLNAIHWRGSLMFSGPGGLSDGGPGGLSDGSPSYAAQANQNTPSSGISVNGIRYLQINNKDTDWNEFEALPTSIRNDLKNGNIVNALYEKDSRYFIYGHDNKLPEWLKMESMTIQNNKYIFPNFDFGKMNWDTMVNNSNLLLDSVTQWPQPPCGLHPSSWRDFREVA